MINYAVGLLSGEFFDEYMEQCWMFDDYPDSLGMWCMGGPL